jgi:hypothetical protein
MADLEQRKRGGCCGFVWSQLEAGLPCGAPSPHKPLFAIHLCFSSCCLTSTVSGGVKSCMARRLQGEGLPDVALDATGEWMEAGDSAGMNPAIGHFN